MSNSLTLNMASRAETENQHGTTRLLSQDVRWLSLLIFILMAAPRIRIVISSAPLYLLDGLIAVLFVSAYNRPKIKRKPITRIVGVYLIFVCLSELRGMAEYMMPAESIYMLVRFCFAISLFFILPKLVTTLDDLAPVLKGAMAGLLVASIITIMYSLAPTRSLIMNTVFSYDFLCPGSESLAWHNLALSGVAAAMRGRSLIGAATMTTGFLGVMWPLAFLACKWPGLDRRWKIIALLASIVAPFAVLMTYGRTAWLIVALIGTMIAIFGFTGGRRNILIAAIGCMLLIHQYGLHSDHFMIDRIMKSTQRTLNQPFEDKGTTERLQSFTEPFAHLWENPFWLIMGAGRTGQRMSRRGDIAAQLFDESGLATHSAFAMAYYSFGLPAAICQVLLILFGFRLILQRLRSLEKPNQEHVLIWQSLLMAWCGMALWWLSGHAIVGEPRGAMLFFFMYGLLLTFDKLQTQNASTIEQGVKIIT